jgi:hypothetical protein
MLFHRVLGGCNRATHCGKRQAKEMETEE